MQRFNPENTNSEQHYQVLKAQAHHKFYDYDAHRSKKDK